MDDALVADDVLADFRKLCPLLGFRRRRALRDQLVLGLVEIIAEVQQQLARRQRLSGQRGGTVRRAAPTLRARVHVEHLLPGELVDVRGAERGAVLEIHLRERAERLELPEEGVRKPGDDVEVLRERQQVQHEEDQQVVPPPSDLGEHRSTAGGEREHARERRRDRRPAALGRDMGDVPVRDVAAGLEAEVGDHDAADAAEDDDGFDVVLTREPVLGRSEPVEPVRVDDEPAHEGIADADQHEDLDQVLQEEVRTAEHVDAEERQMEVRPEPALREGRRDSHAEDREAPEDEEVHPARRLLALVDEELLLPETEDEEGLDALGNLVEEVRPFHRLEHPRAPVDRAQEEAEAYGHDDGVDGESRPEIHACAPIDFGPVRCFERRIALETCSDGPRPAG